MAFIACRFAVWTGIRIYRKQNICIKGTTGSHLSVRTILTRGSATAAMPIIIGNTMNELDTTSCGNI